ncbi:MAG: 5-(carboxyamino)imidazole ribonucleotide synthase [Geminicoccaceae bacterium]
MVEPGATIGVLGGGQLGRMLVAAAVRLGYRTRVLTDQADSPASWLCPDARVASYRDQDALTRFADGLSVVTLEFENIPLETLQFLEGLVPVRPGSEILAVCQDRIAEKRWLAANGFEPVVFRTVENTDDLSTCQELTWERSVLKTARSGYDGKGQRWLAAVGGVAEAWAELGYQPCILEQAIALDHELSVLVARGEGGSIETFPITQNQHRDGILCQSSVPYRGPAKVAEEARGRAMAIAEKLGLVGLLAVEMFVDGNGHLFVNELAPRPHNSGHWTLDAATCDQFEQTVRAICGLPLAKPIMLRPAKMLNLIGDQVATRLDWLATDRAKVHLYGKTEWRAGRKMGHVTQFE